MVCSAAARSHYDAVPTLTALPDSILAGDSYAITLTLPDYPATGGWSVTYAVAGGGVDTWTSVANGDAHALTLTAAETGALPAGLYQYSLRAIKAGGTVETLERGTITVERDVAQLAAGEGVSWAETTLAVVEAALSNTLTGEMKMYMIAGRQVMTFSPAELMRLRSQLRTELAIQRGGRPAGGSIQTVFARR